jgi:hypothetical protein
VRVSETTTHESATRPRQLAIASILLCAAAVVALGAAYAATAAMPVEARYVTRSLWFWIGGIAVVAAALVAVFAHRAGRTQHVAGSWPALATGLVVLVVLVTAYLALLGSTVTTEVTSGRPRRRRARGRRQRCSPSSGPSVEGSLPGERSSGAPTATTADPHSTELGTAERSFVHEMWMMTATQEAGSIATFLQLRAELEALGAPPALLDRATTAAEEEVAHARFAMAVSERARPGSAPTSIDPTAALWYRAPERRCRTSTGRRYRILRLAVEAYLDGGCNEEAAAECLRRAARSCDPSLSTALSAIAGQERTHVELAWSTIEWSIAECGPPVVWTLRRLRPRRPKPGSMPPPSADPQILRTWGWVDPGTTSDTFELARHTARRRLLDLPA